MTLTMTPQTSDNIQPSDKIQVYDLLIVGAGPVGLITALACHKKGATIALIDHNDFLNPANPPSEGRAFALASSSIRLLDNLDIFSLIKDYAQPMMDIILSEGEPGQAASSSLLHFSAHDRANGPSGYIIESHILMQALINAINAISDIHIVAPAQISHISQSQTHAHVHISNGPKIVGSILVAADGRRSICRDYADIPIQTLSYGQKSLIATLAHEKPHDAIAYEIFYPSGPLACLPLSGQRSHIIWTDKERAIDAAMALSETAFIDELSRRMGSHLGPLRLISKRHAYPLIQQLAETYFNQRIVLVGDAAHAIHPIAGQGLNLGLRDAAALADIVHSALSLGLDPAGAGLNQYQMWRRFDNQLIAHTSSLFNGLFSNRLQPLKPLRRWGLRAVNALPATHELIMKEASGELGQLPSLLQ